MQIYHKQTPRNSSYPCPRKNSLELSRFYCKRSQLQKLCHLIFAAVLEETCSFFSMTWHVWNSFQTKIAHTLYRKRCNDVPQIQKLAKLGKPQCLSWRCPTPMRSCVCLKRRYPKIHAPIQIHYTVCCAAVPSTSGQVHICGPYIQWVSTSSQLKLVQHDLTTCFYSFHHSKKVMPPSYRLAPH